MERKDIPESEVFVIPEETVDLLEKNASRVKKLFNVKVQIHDAIVEGDAKIQWVSLMERESTTEEQIRHGKMYIMSMTNPKVSGSLKNCMQSLHRSQLKEIEKKSRAFLMLDGNNMTIRGSELSVFMAKFMLEKILPKDCPSEHNPSEQNIMNRPTEKNCSDQETSETETHKTKKKKKDKTRKRSLEVEDEMEDVHEEEDSKRKSKQKKRKRSDEDDIEEKNKKKLKKVKKTKSEIESGENMNGRLGHSYHADSNEYNADGKEEQDPVSRLYRLDSSAEFVYIGKAGPSHARVKVMSVKVNKQTFEGTGSSKTLAKQAAAENALCELTGEEAETSVKSREKGKGRKNKIQEESTEGKNKDNGSRKEEESEGKKEKGKQKRKRQEIDKEVSETKPKKRRKETGVETETEENLNTNISDIENKTGRERKKKSKKRRQDEGIGKVDVGEEEKRLVEEDKGTSPEEGEQKEQMDVAGSRKPVKVLSRLVPCVQFLLLEKSGPLDNPRYVVSVKVNGKTYKGSGASKKVAKKEAARKALVELSSSPSPSPCPETTASTPTKTPEKRYIVIDGNNVAMEHGCGKTFSAKGIQICVDYFLARGHKLTVFVSGGKRFFGGKFTDSHYLEKLEEEGYLKTTPFRRLSTGQMISSYDDRFIINLADVQGGIIVSNDQFRDLLYEKPSYQDIIENRKLPYMFVDDIFMLPDDPYGRDGPSLDEFLLHGNNNTPVCRNGHRKPTTPSGTSKSPSHNNTASPDESDKAGELNQYRVLKMLGMRHQFSVEVINEALKHCDTTKAVHPDEFIDFVRFFEEQNSLGQD